MTNSTKTTCEDIADFYLALANESGEVITNLKLQKLVYYAQAWYLANLKKPLFGEDFEAWVHGPVIADLYRKFKKFGFGPISINITPKDVKPFDEKTNKILSEVANIYMPLGAYELEAMTHREDPWIDARGGCKPDENCSKIISKKAMMEYYGSKI